MKEQKGEVICIIGMHRSGTSMVAKLLNLCGLELGAPDQLLGSNKSNPLGHFEHKGFIDIDDALLAHFGGSWDDPPLLEQGWERDSGLEPFVQKAKLLLETFFGKSLWGWKEPRTTILLPFWRCLVPNLRFVVCIRSPLEVARSLETRDGMPIKKGVYLWNHYMRAAVRDTEGRPRIFTFYEDHFDDDLREIHRVAEFCELQMPDDLSGLRHAISYESKHYRSETLELLGTDNVRTEDKLFYIGLRALLFQGFIQTKSERTREALISEYASRFSCLIEEFHNQGKLAQLQTMLAEKDQQMIKYQAEVKKILQDLKGKEQEIVQLQQRSGQFEEDNRKLQAFSDAVRQTLAYRFYRKFIKPFRA